MACCLSLCPQRDRPCIMRQAAYRGQPAAAVSGLQKHAAGRGRPRHPPDLSLQCPCGSTAPRCGLSAVSPQCCQRNQSQVRNLLFFPHLFVCVQIGAIIKGCLLLSAKGYSVLQVQQSRLSVSKCRNYAQSISGHRSIFQRSFLQVGKKHTHLHVIFLLHFLPLDSHPGAQLMFVSLLSPLQKCHQHVCDCRRPPNSAGQCQLRWSTRSFCHKSIWTFSFGKEHIYLYMEYLRPQK